MNPWSQLALPTFRCGHPRIPSNTRVQTIKGCQVNRCRLCQNEFARLYQLKRYRERASA
jgi:hypothetical protein